MKRCCRRSPRFFVNVTLADGAAEIKLLADHAQRLPADLKNAAALRKMGGQWKLTQEDGATSAVLRLSKGGDTA